MKTQMIKLNLIPGAMPGGLRPAINVSQYDVGRPLKFQLYDGKTKAEIEYDTVITVHGTKPDKTGFAYACTWSGNEVTVATQKQMTVCAGKVDCELHLVKDTQEIGTANFILEVEPAALSDDTVISDSEMPAIVEAARKNTLTDESVQTLVDSASAAASAAENAANSASAAATAETNASNSASEAAQSKTAAANSASAAATSKIDAERAASSASASEASASQSATRAQEYAAQALENATGVKEFSGSDPGLVPRSTKTGAFLRSDGEWADDVATDEDMTALRTSLQTSFQDGVDAIYGAITAKNVIPSASTPTALATAVSAVYDRGRSLGDSEGYARGHAQGLEDGQHIVKLGSGTSYNVSSYKGYKNFTKDNFIVKIKNISITNQMVQSSHSSSMGVSAPFTTSGTVTPSVSYNASTGTVTISNLSGTCNNSYYPTTTITSASNVTVTASVDVYLVY